MNKLIVFVITILLSSTGFAAHFKCIVKIEGQEEKKRMDVQADSEKQARSIVEADLQFMYSDRNSYKIELCEKVSDF